MYGTRYANRRIPSEVTEDRMSSILNGTLPPTQDRDGSYDPVFDSDNSRNSWRRAQTANPPLRKYNNMNNNNRRNTPMGHGPYPKPVNIDSALQRRASQLKTVHDIYDRNGNMNTYYGRNNNKGHHSPILDDSFEEIRTEEDGLLNRGKRIPNNALHKGNKYDNDYFDEYNPTRGDDEDDYDDSDEEEEDEEDEENEVPHIDIIHGHGSTRVVQDILYGNPRAGSEAVDRSHDGMSDHTSHSLAFGREYFPANGAKMGVDRKENVDDYTPNKPHTHPHAYPPPRRNGNPSSHHRPHPNPNAPKALETRCRPFGGVPQRHPSNASDGSPLPPHAFCHRTSSHHSAEPFGTENPLDSPAFAESSDFESSPNPKEGRRRGPFDSVERTSTHSARRHRPMRQRPSQSPHAYERMRRKDPKHAVSEASGSESPHEETRRGGHRVETTRRETRRRERPSPTHSRNPSEEVEDREAVERNGRTREKSERRREEGHSQERKRQKGTKKTKKHLKEEEREREKGKEESLDGVFEECERSPDWTWEKSDKRSGEEKEEEEEGKKKKKKKPRVSSKSKPAKPAETEEKTKKDETQKKDDTPTEKRERKAFTGCFGWCAKSNVYEPSKKEDKATSTAHASNTTKAETAKAKETEATQRKTNGQTDKSKEEKRKQKKKKTETETETEEKEAEEETPTQGRRKKERRTAASSSADREGSLGRRRRKTPSQSRGEKKGYVENWSDVD